MVLGYLASSWNSLRSGKKTESQQSQQSQDEIASDPPAIQGTDQSAPPNSLPSLKYQAARSDVDLSQDAIATDDPTIVSNEHGLGGYDMTSSLLGSSSRRGRKDRQKKRKRRPSIDTSILAPESESGDVASIPYRADEQAERDAFVAHEDSMLNQNQSISTDNNTFPQTDVSNGIPAYDISESTAEHDKQSHARSVVPAENISIQDRGSPKIKITANGSRDRYPCPGANEYSCDKSFSMMSAARRHMKAAHSKERFQCPVCDNVYTRADTLHQHLLTHSPAAMQITENDTITRPEAATAEVLTHTPSNTDGEAQGRMSDPTIATNGSFVGINADVDMEDVSEIPHTELDITYEDVADHPDAAQPQNAGSGLKRKRTNNGSTPHTNDRSSKRRKRGAQSALRPPTSATSEVEGGSHKIQKTSDTKTKLLKSGNLNGFAKPWLPGSDLHHPVFNPRSPRSSSKKVQVVVPESSRASLERRNLAEAFTNAVEETPLAGKKKRLAAYSSAKGKQRAEPDVEYTSPERPRHDESEMNGHEQNSNDEDEIPRHDQTGMATSVAKRTPSISASGNTPRQSVDHSEEEEMGHTESGSSADDEDQKDQNGDLYLCQECHRKFPSLKLLRKHEARPDAHKLIQRCEECNKTFGSREMLRHHQRDRGHGDGTGYSGRKGPFSASEINKLHRWRDRLCKEYDINHVDFNNMMTDSLRRHKGFVWPYKFIAKAEFLQEYYDILPGRNRRSMHRYRERAFQNLSSNLEWTQQDDRELRDLVNELGPKWVEIGQRMSRTSDAVNQRWRNKVQHRGKLNDGEWFKDETEQLVKAVNQVKRESGISLDPHADVKVPWDSVSKRMKGNRTAQQCSNKWRLLYTVRKNGVFLKPDGPTPSRSNSSTPLTSRTPSKMSQRLAGETPSTNPNGSKARRKPISDQFVHDFEDDDARVDQPSPDPEHEYELESEPETEAELDAEAETAEGTQPESNQENAEENGKLDNMRVAKIADHDEQSEEDSLHSSFANDEPDGQGGLAGESTMETGGDRLEGFDEIRDTGSQSPNEAYSGDNASDHDPIESASIPEQRQQSQATQSGSEQSESESVPGLPQNPLGARTPRHNNSLSQAFNQTQANTSAVRAPRTDTHNGSQPPRPSPQVTIRARPVATAADTPVYHGSQINDHAASSDDSSADETSESNSSSEDSDNDTMVQDTRKESFLQSLRSLASQRSDNAERSSTQAPPRRVNWVKALQGQNVGSEGSSSSSGDSDSDDEDK